MHRLADRFTDDLDSLVAASAGRSPTSARCCWSTSRASSSWPPPGSAVTLLLSDVTAGAAWDLAADVLDELEVPVPDEDEMDEVWPVGDLRLVDLGMDELALGAVLADVDAYADEQLMAIARACGFERAWRGVNEAALR